MLSAEFSQLNECDHCVLNFIDCHLLKDGKNGLECSQIQLLLTRFREAFNCGAAISLSKNGDIQFITQKAKEILSQYFPDYKNLNSLPTHLKQWFDYQTSQMSLGADSFSAYLKLHIEQDERELNLYLIGKKARGPYVLLLEEKKANIFSINDLELLGLTKREAEVLFWVANDKSNIEIAKIIDCSEGTVRKHLEHIHIKLNVRTRTGAVIVALEKLGILRR